MDTAWLPLAFPPRSDFAPTRESVDRVWWTRTVVPWAGDLVAEWELQRIDRARDALVAEGEVLCGLLHGVATPWVRERDILVPKATRRLLEWAADTSDALVAVLGQLDSGSVDRRKHGLTSTGLAMCAGLAVCATIRSRSATGARAAWARIMQAA